MNPSLRISCTHELIVETALQMADDQGMEQLSMRKLATEVEAGVMSLYHYVADKDALMEQMLDVLATAGLPPDVADLGHRRTRENPE